MHLSNWSAFIYLFFTLASVSSAPQRTGLQNWTTQPDFEEENQDGNPLEALPSSTQTDDKSLGAALTRTFQEELLPNLKSGIPELGIRSIDPMRVADFTLTNFDFRFLRCVSQVSNVVLLGFANISLSRITVNSKEKRLTADFDLPAPEGNASCITNCYLFGLPLWRPRTDGFFEFKMRDMRVFGTFSHRSTPGEIIRLRAVDLTIKQFWGWETGTMPEAVVAATNQFARRFGVPFYNIFMRTGLEDAVVNIFERFMTPTVWQSIFGDFL